jgi:hypothetical protein
MAVTADVVNAAAVWALCITCRLCVEHRRMPCLVRLTFRLNNWYPVRAAILPWQRYMSSN